MKYTVEDLQKLNGKPVYVVSLDKTHVWKDGWAIAQTIENNENVFATNGSQTILLSAFLGKWFEAYDREPELEKTEKEMLKDELWENIRNYTVVEDNKFLNKIIDITNKLLNL